MLKNKFKRKYSECKDKCEIKYDNKIITCENRTADWKSEMGQVTVKCQKMISPFPQPGNQSQ